ncbi:Hsp33 family molecular chaperone HslO [Paenibacillus humicola]|uniref:Hsp33 family molecular chaperone HslO n=1 Tax=Paenibacillus humicola TaxID=3110540 RepID=UPI00237BC298|nr:Hsp33 family molecular chaperone HslO [Paenibacillus humicola]
MESTSNDYLVRGTAWGGKLRLFAVTTSALVDELRRRQGTLPTTTAALGRIATAGAMMGAMLKGEEKLTIQVKGDGPVGQIVVDANARGEVRGYVDHPQVQLASNALGKLDVAGAVGRSGHIHVIKDLGLKDPYRGSIPIVSGELAEDFTYYFATSEQTPSVVGLSVLVDEYGRVLNAGGFIVQMMPGCEEDEIAKLERSVSVLPPISALLDQGETPEGLLRWVVGENMELLDRMDVIFKCKCSRERVERTLISMGEQELRQLIEEDGKAEVVCHFCNEKYAFDREQLMTLLDQAKPKPIS